MSKIEEPNNSTNGNNSSVINKSVQLHSNATPKIIAPDSPTKATRSPSIGDSTSLNDDLASLSGSNNRHRQSSRMSLDSYSVRRSFESSVMGRNNRSFGFDNENHSGSVEFSPLGNNSIYEIVMNTRRKGWLGYPTVSDIPPVVLTKNEIERSWKNAVRNYVDEIKNESSIFESTNNLRSMTRMEQLKQLEDYDTSLHDLTDADDDEAEYKRKESLKDLDEVPPFYFEKDFQLDNPRTFHRVLKDVDLHLNKLSGEDQAQSDNAYMELKDRLNYYLDAVENLLVGEISKSSHKFFHALGDIDLIQQKAASTVSELDSLAENADLIDRVKIQKRIENLQKIFKRKNIQKLEQGLLQVKQVLERAEECEGLYKNEEYDTCLDLIKSIDCLIKGDDSQDLNVQSWVCDWPFKLVDLKAVPALTETREFLTNMKIEIGGKFSLQLCDLLLEDVRKYCRSVDKVETLKRFQNMSIDKKYLLTDSEFEAALAGLIHQLRRCEELPSAFNLYQDKCTAEIKSIIKANLPQEQHLPSEDGQTPGLPRSQPSVTSGSKLSRLIKEQTPMEFQEMLVNIFTRSSEALRRLYRHQKLLLDLSLSEITSSEQSTENQQGMITQLDIRTGINEAIRILQLRMGKIIAVRRDSTSALRFDHFLKLYSICVLFIQECEAVSGEFLTKYLSDVLTAQIKNYIAALSTRSIRIIQNKIEVERWTPFIVNSSVQKDVNDIVSSMDLDPLDWVKFSDLVNKQPSGETPVKAEGKEQTSEANRLQLGHRKSVVVGDKTFVASDSLLTCIELIKEILILSTNLPVTYLSSFEKLCYDLLRYFNNFAMSSASEPGQTLSKSAKNLSIMGESLDCLGEFVHIVQRYYQGLSNSSRDFTPYDQSNYTQLLQQYQASAEKIYLANAPPPPL